MSKEYWDKKLINDYGKKDWAYKPSIFAGRAIEFFPKTGNILEIGTGMGNDADFFLSRGYDVVATDLSDVAIKDDAQRIKGVRFVSVDTASGLPFDDEAFDVVYSHMALHYFDAATTEKVFRDIHRVLKKDGIFATIANTIDDPDGKSADCIRLEPDYYQDPKTIIKRYFSVDSMKRFTEDLFDPIFWITRGRRTRTI